MAPKNAKNPASAKVHTAPPSSTTPDGQEAVAESSGSKKSTLAPPRNLVDAKLHVQIAVPYVRKRGTMSGGGSYKYVRDTDLIAQLKPHMIQNGLTLCGPVSIESHTADTVSTRSSTMNRMIAVYRFQLRFVNTNEVEDVVVIGEGADNLDKSSNKSMAAARKYALLLAFNISTGDDPDQFDEDGNQHDHEDEHGRPSHVPASAPSGAKHAAPAQAAPAAPATAPADKPKTDGKASTLPKTGKELHDRLAVFDEKLATTEKACVRGALLASVTASGVKAGYGANMTEWSGKQIEDAVKWATTFADEARAKSKAAPAAPATAPAAPAAPAKSESGRPTTPTPEAVEAFNKRIAGMNGSKTTANLNKFREIYSADARMTTGQLADLEKCYWANTARLEGNSAPE